MPTIDIDSLIKPYSPWLDENERPSWVRIIPVFHRPVFEKLVDDVDALKQIISITGPRRVGKSTLLQQLVLHLIREKHVEPHRVIYYSFDDPALFRKRMNGGDVLELLMQKMTAQQPPSYLFLDEIQALERWEQYLKKYIDLHYPVRVVISGSASSPIFKKSRESLMGRVKDYHVLPFSFREFLMHNLQDNHDLLSKIEKVHSSGDELMGMLAKSPQHFKTESVSIRPLPDDLWAECEKALPVYLVDGGFPEVWEMPTAEKKIEYLFDNQVKKVIFEDLVLATEFRKPEQLKTFYVSLLERPGTEVNTTSLSNDIGVNVQQIDKYLPLLEMTDLIAHASKFRKSPVRVRVGNRKFYLVDLALRNAVLRIGDELLSDDAMLGLYAENLVFNALHKLPGVLQIDYYREGNYEVDFIVHLRPSRYLPIEVKYTNDPSVNKFKGLQHFMSRYVCSPPIIVTKNQQDFGYSELNVEGRRPFMIPLPNFLLLFD